MNGLIAWCKRELTLEFEMKDLGLMHYFLGLEAWQRQGEMFLAQGKYTVDVLKEVWYDGLEIYVYSDGYQPEEAT
jgi:hypothetical protein